MGKSFLQRCFDATLGRLLAEGQCNKYVVFVQMYVFIALSAQENHFINLPLEIYNSKVKL